ncbi:hypothetical protein HHI36_009832 [Cryptolaemus montrouzieri]|uniref:Uncharacterized protein n=1 Tax=Cryptolaemus montrouzieri TaxID=559131 RepID=A0ABD2MGZ7_9CUCU
MEAQENFNIEDPSSEIKLLPQLDPQPIDEALRLENLKNNKQKSESSTKPTILKNNDAKTADRLSFMHQNVQSIRNCIALLEHILEIRKYDCFAVTEHWCDEEQLRATHLRNYDLASSYRRSKNERGGSAIYLRDGVFGKVTPHQNINSLASKFDFECTAVSVNDGHEIIIKTKPYGKQ